MMASEVRVMEKTSHLQQQQPPQPPLPPHEALKCPRCDSSNTKFCYYNNYSLSQPRHFCKACKRYWTRGGTLRNVPVGGGCRKNKRVKRPITTTSTSTNVQHHVSSSSPNTTTHPQLVINHRSNNYPNPNPNNNHHDIQNQIIPSSSSAATNNNHHLNPLFYGLIPQNPNYPRFDTRVSSVNENLVSRYGHLIQPHMNAASGLAFSLSGTGGSPVAANHDHNSSSLNFGSYNNNSFLYGGGGATCSSTSAPTTMASLLASTFNQQQRVMGFASYDGGNSDMVKDLKLENSSQNKMEWNGDHHNNNFHGQNKSDHQIEASDPNTAILWDAEGGGWLDPTNNIGSSVPSLI